MKNILIAMPFDDTHKAYIEKIGTEVEDDDYLTFGIFSVRAIQE